MAIIKSIIIEYTPKEKRMELKPSTTKNVIKEKVTSILTHSIRPLLKCQAKMLLENKTMEQYAFRTLMQASSR